MAVLSGASSCSCCLSSRRRHTRSLCDWSSDVCSSDLLVAGLDRHFRGPRLVRTLIMDDCPYDGQPDERTGHTMAVDQAEGPLAGLLVADFSRILAGPYATMLLADMGAE